MKVIIGYMDGQYFYRDVAGEDYDGPDVADVPESTVEMWDAITRLNYEVQRQLHKLDEQLNEDAETD